jgi:hypothetical protein
MNQETEQPIDPEVMNNSLELSKPSMPVTVDELAANNAGVDIVKRREEIVTVMRKASVSMTFPQDWLLFKADDRETAFLQDSGCQRVMQLWGIEITPTGDFVTTTVDDEKYKGEYAITCYGDAYCHVTGLSMKGIEGTRYSFEDFVNPRMPMNPIMKKIRVQQASVANRNGNAVRKLTGLSNVAKEFLEEVWQGTGKSTKLCAQGKGYGSKAERMGAQVQQSEVPAGEEPICVKCGSKMKFIQAGISKTQNKPYDAFWACQNQECKATLKHADFLAVKGASA